MAADRPHVCDLDWLLAHPDLIPEFQWPRIGLMSCAAAGGASCSSWARKFQWPRIGLTSLAPHACCALRVGIKTFHWPRVCLPSLTSEQGRVEGIGEFTVSMAADRPHVCDPGPGPGPGRRRPRFQWPRIGLTS